MTMSRGAWWSLILAGLAMPGLAAVHPIPEAPIPIEPARLASAALPLPPGQFEFSPQEVSRLERASGLPREELVRAMAEHAKGMARALVGGFAVGAAGLGESGAVYLGGNLEFPGSQWAQAVHAEQAVIAHARIRGESGLVCLAVSAPPCGHCRQFLHELGAGDGLKVLVQGQAPVTLKDLLPMPFGVGGGVLPARTNDLVLARGGAAGASPLMEAALEAANMSHSQHGPAGVALKMRDGRVFLGPYIQVAGANPSLAPLQAALVALVAANARYEDIAAAALVQLEDEGIDHAGATEAVLKTIAPAAVFESRRARRLEPPNGRPDFIAAARFQELLGELKLERDELLLALLAIAKEASRPEVSGYRVGAVGLGASGNVYLGGNLSFNGVPINQSNHAEQSVVANARRHGERALVALAVTDEPCGHCRQFLREVDPSLGMRILIRGKPATTLKDLLPRPFVLGDPPSLLARYDNGLVAPPARARAGVSRDLLEAALAAANASNSRFNPSGVALRTKDGHVFSDGYLEVQGGYSSLSPLIAALGQLVREGRPYADVTEAVLVEFKGARVVQRDAARQLLKEIAPHARLRVVEVERKQ